MGTKKRFLSLKSKNLFGNNEVLCGKTLKILPSMGSLAARCFSSPSGREQ